MTIVLRVLKCTTELNVHSCYTNVNVVQFNSGLTKALPVGILTYVKAINYLLPQAEVLL